MGFVSPHVNTQIFQWIPSAFQNSYRIIDVYNDGH